MDYFTQILQCHTKEDIYGLANIFPYRWINGENDYDEIRKQREDHYTAHPPDPQLIREVSVALRSAIANGLVRFASNHGHVRYGFDDGASMDENENKDCRYWFNFEPASVSIRICPQKDSTPDASIMNAIKRSWFTPASTRRKSLAGAIYDATLRNDPSTLQAVLTIEEANPNEAVDSSLDSALCHAAAYGFNNCGKLLIEHGADIEHRGNGGRKPLYYAAQSNNSEFALFLLGKGADARCASDPVMYSNTPLHYAATHCNLDLVRCLLEKGADANAMADNGGGTPLYRVGRSSKWHDRALCDEVRSELARNGARNARSYSDLR